MLFACTPCTRARMLVCMQALTCACMHDRTYSTHAHAHARARARTHARTHASRHARTRTYPILLFLGGRYVQGWPTLVRQFWGTWFMVLLLGPSLASLCKIPSPNTHPSLSLYHCCCYYYYCYIILLLFISIIVCGHVRHAPDAEALCVCVCVCSHSHEIEVDGLRCTCCRVCKCRAYTHTQLRFTLITTCIVVYISRVLARACPRARVSTCAKIECL